METPNELNHESASNHTSELNTTDMPISVQPYASTTSPTPENKPEVTQPETQKLETVSVPESEESAGDESEATGNSHVLPAEEDQPEPQEAPAAEAPKDEENDGGQKRRFQQILDSIPEEEQGQSRMVDDPEYRPNNLSTSIKMLVGKVDSLLELMIRYGAPGFNDEANQKLLKNPNSWLSHYSRAEQYTNEVVKDVYYAIKDELSTTNKTMAELVKKSDEVHAEYNLLRVARGEKPVTHKVSGEAARLVVIARTRGIIRTYLFNSGFWIEHVPFSLDQMDEFYAVVVEEHNNLGNLLGGHVNLVNDILIKERFIELFKSNIVNASIVDWRDRFDEMINLIRSTDYFAMVGDSCRHLYPNGIEIELVCSDPKCGRVDTGVDVDLSKTRIDLTDRMPDSAFKFVVAGNPHTIEEVKEYQKGNWRLGVVDEKNQPYIYRLTEPGLMDMIKHGKEIISDIAVKLNKSGNDPARQVDKLLIQVHRMFSPWIYEIDDRNGTEGSIITDRKAIDTLLDLTMSTDIENEEVSIIERFEEFIMRRQITFFAYRGVKCPYCGATSVASLDDMTPVDVQSLFFYLCCRKLGHQL